MDHQLTKWRRSLRLLSRKVAAKLPGSATPALVLAAFIFPFLLLRSTLSTTSTPRFHPDPLRSGFSGSNSAFSTHLTASKKTANITVSRGFSSLEFSLPLENAKITSSGDKINYAIPENNLSVQYQLTDQSLKEEIILEKAPSTNLIKSNLKTRNLTPYISPEGTLVFLDHRQNYQFHFERPFAVDAKGNVTYNLRFYIKDKKQNITPVSQTDAQGTKLVKQLFGNLTKIESLSDTLILEVDNRWLNDPSRVYPITIDPTVVHNTQSEFSLGSLNRLTEKGAGETAPALEDFYPETQFLTDTEALWRLDETTGNAVSDVNGTHPGTAFGTTITTGLFGKARTFNGTSDYISIPDSQVFDNGSITISAWINPSNPGANGQIFDHGGNTGYRFRVNGNRLEFLDRSTTNLLQSNSQLSANTWYHVAVVADPSGIYFYINGLLDNSKNTGFGAPRNAVEANIGRAALYGEYFKGTIDDVAFFTRSLSPTEIKTLAQRRSYATYISSVIDLDNVTSWNSLSWTAEGRPTQNGETLFDATGLVAQWNLNEAAGTSAVSSAGTCTSACLGTLNGFDNLSAKDIGHTLSLTGWTAVNSRWGNGALMFDGINDYVSLTSNANFKSIEFWIKRTSYITAVMQLSVNSTITIDAYGNLKLGTGFLSPTLYINGQAGQNYLPPDVWNHVVINSDQVNTLSSPYFGRVGTTYFKGILDSIRLYNRPLTAAEIASNYNHSNLEFLTRSSADGVTWESWRGAVGDTQIAGFNTASSTLTSTSGNYYPDQIPLSILNTGITPPTAPAGCPSHKLLTINTLGISTTYADVTINVGVSGISGKYVRFTNAQGVGLTTTSYTGSYDVRIDSASAQSITPFYVWYGCGTSLPTYTTAQQSNNFYWSGDPYDTTDVTVGGGVYGYDPTYGWPYITNNSDAWDSYVYSNRIFTRQPGLTFDAWLGTAPGDRVMVGWRDDTTNNGYAPFTYAIFFNNGSFKIYEDNNDRGSVGVSYVSFKDPDYQPNEVKIVLKEAGADYYYYDLWNGLWISLYRSNYSTRQNLRTGLIHYDSAEKTYVSSMTTYYESPDLKLTEEPTAIEHPEGSGSVRLQNIPQADDHTLVQYLFDESGGKAINSTPQYYVSPGSVGTSIPIVNGVSGYAREIGTSDNTYVELGNSAYNSFTLEAWINPTDTHEVDSESTSGTGGLSGQKWLFSYSSLGYDPTISNTAVSAGTNGISVYEIGCTGTDCLTTTFYPNTVYSGRLSGWNHVAVVYNRRSPSIWLNGNLVRTGRTSTKSYIFTPGYLGNFNSGTEESFKGKVDEVILSDIDRSASYIAQRYRAGQGFHLNYTISPTQNLSASKYLTFLVASDHLGTPLTLSLGSSAASTYDPGPNVAALYHLDEINGVGNYIVDSSSYTNNAPLVIGSTSPIYAVGKIGGARNFDGGDVINVGNPTQLKITGSQTISMWLRPTDFGSRRNPICKSYVNEFCITQETDGRLNYYFGTSTSNYTSIGSNYPLIGNRWNHIAVVRDYTSNRVRFYINGRKTSETTPTITAPTTSSNAVTIGDGYAGNYVGTIDEVMITNNALTDAQVSQLYNTGAQAHTVNIDFKARLDYNNTIIGSSDPNFIVDERPFGNSARLSHLNRYDKVIVREKIGGNFYTAQGEVASINKATGLVTVSSWESGSTFPPSGFSRFAVVFKWQREYIDISQLPASARASIDNLGLVTTDKNFSNVWLDDIHSVGNFLNLSAGSTITSTTNRYIQYQAIYSSSPDNINTSAKLNSVTLDYKGAPVIPVVQNDYLHDNVKVGTTRPEIRFTSTANAGENITYEIQFGTDSDFVTSTTRNSGTAAGFANITTPADTSPFNSGDTVSYTFTTADNLQNNTTYFYRLRASNGTIFSSWSPYRSFTTDATITKNYWFQTHADQFRSNANSSSISLNDAGNYLSIGVTSATAPGWRSIQTLAIANTGPDVSNADVLIDLDTASLISSEKLQSNCQDLRFKDSDQSTSLAYWIESGCNTAHTQVWVRLSLLPNGGKSIYLFFNNPDATAGETAWSGYFISAVTGSCPTGWTLNSSFLNRLPYISTSYGATGGSATHTHSNISGTVYVSNGTTIPTITSGTGNYVYTPTSYHSHSFSIPVNPASSLPSYITTPFCNSSKLNYPSSTVTLLSDSSPPVGNWSLVTELVNTFPLGSNTFGTIGGGDTHAHTTSSTVTNTSSSRTNLYYTYNMTLRNPYTPDTHTHSIPSMTTTNSSNIPSYYTLSFIKSDAGSTIPPGVISMANSLPPLGWTSLSVGTSRYLRGSSTPNTNFVANTHLHYLPTFTTGLGTTSYIPGYFNVGSPTSYFRSHTAYTYTQYSSSSVTNAPPYLSVPLYKKKASPYPVTPGTIADYATGGTILSSAITADDIYKNSTTYHQFIFHDDQSYGDIRYYFYAPDDDGNPVIIPNEDLPGNGGGFDASPVNLTTLSTQKYPVIYVYAELNLAGANSPILNDWAVTFNQAPAVPVLTQPTDGQTELSLTPVLRTAASDNDTDYLQYKIEICTDSSMTQNCFTVDQTTSQVGWSGMDALGGTTFSSGSTATYSIQEPLTVNTTYYWRSYAIDPAGSNSWSSTQATPRSFKIATKPITPNACRIDEFSQSDSGLHLLWNDNATDESGYEIWRSVNGSAATLIQSVSVGSTGYVDLLSQPGAYGYQIRAQKTSVDGGRIYSDYCSTSTLDLEQGNLYLDGLRLDGLKLN